MNGRIQYGVAAVLFASVLVLSAVAGASDIGQMVNKACTKCHSAARICNNLGVKNGTAWETNVKRMVNKGAQIPADRVGEAASYLTGLKSGSSPLCD